MATTNWSDPCARAAALTAAYYQLVSGAQEAEIESKFGEGGERVKFSRTDLNTLRAEMQSAQALCDQAAGRAQKPRRSAISLGARPRVTYRGFPR